MPTAQIAIQGQRNEDDELARHLDWADEAREAASIQMAAYQQKVAAYYNRRVRPQIFKEGSLLLRKIFENTAEKGVRNFRPIGKVLMWYQKPTKMGRTICKP